MKTLSDQIDTITSIAHISEHIIASTSADGSVLVTDLRSDQAPIHSASLEEELLCSAVLPTARGTKYLVGSQSGFVHIWGDTSNWRDFESNPPAERLRSPDISGIKKMNTEDEDDRYAIECMLPNGRGNLITIHNNGCIRRCHITPNKFEGLLAKYTSPSGTFGLAPTLYGEKKIFTSAGATVYMQSTKKFIDPNTVDDDGDLPDSDEGQPVNGTKAKRQNSSHTQKPKKKNTKEMTKSERTTFFSGL